MGIILVLIAFAFIVLLWNKWLIIFNFTMVARIIRLFRNVHRLHDHATNFLKQNGGTILFKGPWFSGMNFVVTSDPINVHYILTRNFANYHKGPEFKEILEPLGDGILASDSDSWRFQRRIVHSLFTHKRFKMVVETIMKRKILNGLFPVLENISKLRNEIDLQDIFQRLMFDNICSLVLGFDPNCLSVEFPQVVFEKAFHDMEVAVFYRHVLPTKIWKLQRWLRIGKEKNLRQALRTIDRFMEQHIARKRHQLLRKTKIKSKIDQNDDNDDDDFDLLTYFLAEDGENGMNFKSNKFARDMTFNLLAAGRDTIGAALCWFFWVVFTNPFVEQKILEEMKVNLLRNRGDDDDGKLRIFSYEEHSKLVYLHAVICEALRLYPPIPFDHIVSIGEDILPSGHNIASNMRILYSLYSMGRMEEIWGKDCLEFKPERWISKEGQIVHVPSYKFIVFNAGPRACVGKNLTFMQMKAVACAVIWNYSIQVVQNHPVIPSLSMVSYMRPWFEG